MAHFAELDENNVVLRVIVVGDKDIQDDKSVEKEEIGIAFCKSLFGENTKWIQTSFNGNIRGQFAGVGDLYDETEDVFVIDERAKRKGIVVADTDIIDAEVVEPTKALE
jgi:hypothetical protein